MKTVVATPFRMWAEALDLTEMNKETVKVQAQSCLHFIGKLKSELSSEGPNWDSLVRPDLPTPWDGKLIDVH